MRYLPASPGGDVRCRYVAVSDADLGAALRRHEDIDAAGQVVDVCFVAFAAYHNALQIVHIILGGSVYLHVIDTFFFLNCYTTITRSLASCCTNFGLTFCYSGDNTTYNNLRPGARIIDLTEGSRSYVTWILEDDGRVVDKVEFSDNKITKRK